MIIAQGSPALSGLPAAAPPQPRSHTLAATRPANPERAVATLGNRLKNFIPPLPVPLCALCGKRGEGPPVSRLGHPILTRFPFQYESSQPLWHLIDKGAGENHPDHVTPYIASKASYIWTHGKAWSAHPQRSSCSGGRWHCSFRAHMSARIELGSNERPAGKGPEKHENEWQSRALTSSAQWLRLSLESLPPPHRPHPRRNASRSTNLKIPFIMASSLLVWRWKLRCKAASRTMPGPD